MLITLVLILSSFGFFGLVSLFLQRKHINYSENFPILAIYNLVASLVLFAFFNSIVMYAYASITVMEYGVVFVSILFVFSLGNLINKKLPVPRETRSKYPHAYILNFDGKYIVTKVSDILFQQLLVVTLISFFMQQGLSKPETITYFSIFFVFIHGILLPFMGTIAWTHVALSVLPSVLFAYLILTYQYGFVYAFCIHLLGYLLFRVFLWYKYR